LAEEVGSAVEAERVVGLDMAAALVVERGAALVVVVELEVVLAKEVALAGVLEEDLEVVLAGVAV
jgi:hypothetical protein